MTHSDRTLKRHFGHPSKANILRHLQQALWGSFTKKGCEDNIQAAINASHDEKEKEYIRKEWFNTMDKWASYARQYSSLLLQVRTTSPLEAWHGALKKKSKQAMGSWSLCGAVDRIMEISKKWSYANACTLSTSSAKINTRRISRS